MVGCILCIAGRTESIGNAARKNVLTNKGKIAQSYIGFFAFIIWPVHFDSDRVVNPVLNHWNKKPKRFQSH